MLKYIKNILFLFTEIIQILVSKRMLKEFRK